METRTESPPGGRLASPAAQLAIVILLVLALRLPFLNQAIQGDDVYYLYGAQHALVDPAHPYHTRYVFLGDMVDMRGHPHPPLNVWFLAGLLAIFHDVHEIPFHAAYILFSLIAAVSAWAIARRFTPFPVLAAALFVVTPAFVVNGTSLESDLPFVAFFLASIALFEINLPLACVAMALAALSAYQAIVLVPILFVSTWKRHRSGDLCCLTPVAVIVAWQVYERFSSGSMPASVLAGYMQSYGFEALTQKLKSAVALTGHLGWLVFPLLTFAAFGRRARFLIVIMVAAALWDYNPLFWISIAAGAAVLIWCAEHWRDFLAQWILIFFAAALIIFFAGSARYLLPIALPVAILAAKQLSPKWLYAGIVLQAALSVSLAAVNYKHWNGYRQFASNLAHDAATKRVWVNGEWGLRYYFESEGALPLERGQVVQPGDMVVSSSLANPLKFTTGGGIPAPVAAMGITSRIPLRLLALNTRSAYSSAGLGLRPFDISRGPIDFVRADIVVERTPTREYVPMNAPDAEQQIVSGIYDLEEKKWRWTSAKAVVLLKSPTTPAPLKVELFIPDQAPARTVQLSVDDRPLPAYKYDRPGAYTITTPPVTPAGATTTLTISVDKTFSAGGDQRSLGVVLTGAGFAQ